MGHTITPNSKAISEKRIKAIRDVPRPITKKQLLSFLGMCAYCRTFIPNYAFLEKPLRALTTGKGLRSCDKIERPFTQMVDMWSKWVEAFPTSKQDSAAVAKALLTEIVPRWGIPRKISSDNGRHFVNDAIKQVGQFLGIDMRTHCSYTPSSGGAIERQNQTIKNKLAKCCEETGLTWLKALPIVLMYMRMRKRVKPNLSPFEILFGRPPFMGIEGGKQRLPSTDVCENDMLNYCK